MHLSRDTISPDKLSQWDAIPRWSMYYFPLIISGLDGTTYSLKYTISMSLYTHISCFDFQMPNISINFYDLVFTRKLTRWVSASTTVSQFKGNTAASAERFLFDTPLKLYFTSWGYTITSFFVSPEIMALLDLTISWLKIFYSRWGLKDKKGIYNAEL